MNLLNLFLIPISVILISCTPKIWVVESDILGGTLGYYNSKKRNFTETYNKRAQDLCPDRYWQTVHQQQHSKSYTYTSYENRYHQVDFYKPSYEWPMLDRKTGSAIVTTQVPVERSGTDYWWEDRIRCGSFKPAHILAEEYRSKKSGSQNKNGEIDEDSWADIREKDSPLVGIIVTKVKYKPLKKTGLEKGDTIVEINSISVNSFDDFKLAVGKIRNNSSTQIKFCKPDGVCESNVIVVGDVSH